MAEPKAAPAAEAPVADAPQADAPAPRTYSQEEVDRITDKVRRNARRDTELRFRREQQSAPAPRAEERKDPPPPPEDKEPAREDFDTFEAHQRALAAYEGRKAAREERKKADEEAQQRTHAEKQKQAQQAWHSKIKKARAKLADMEDVLEDSPETLELVYRSPMKSAIVESEIGPEIIYRLCKAPEEAKRIAALPGYKQAAEIVKLEDAILAESKPADDKGDEAKEDDPPPADAKPRDESTGRFQKKDPPPPIDPGSGRSATTSGTKPSDKDNAEDWRRKRLAQKSAPAGKK